ncbi:Jerky -like [Araneus ventricosus]|uniref:Jerky-like n=1 Tax=Araneus ventricosus TaxID=182803 RepID=A0A4Y2NEN8_ARAVE|nr:Jerky -like [Araneus ventricosus]
MSNKRKHGVCSLKYKLDVLARLDKGESATKLAAEFGIGKATIRDWKKNRSKIEQFISTTSERTLKERKALKVSHHENIDEALYLLFSQEGQKGMPISGPLIQEKAYQLNTLMDGDLAFVASCEDATERTVIEWLSCDIEANQLYTDEEIFYLVQNKPQDDSDLEETDEPENVLVSHSEAANALEIALRYTDKSENVTSTDIMFMRRWQKIASTSRITSLRQTNFFTPKDR